jgi:Zn-finger nucleic acid-binding protein
VGYVTAGVFSILISTYVIREVCYRRFGIDVCPGAAGSWTRARERRQVMMDERAAMEIQQAMEREDRTSASNRRREERRAKYEVFLKPYTMVICQDDFYRPAQQGLSLPKEQPEPHDDIETGSVPSMGNIDTFSSSDSGEDEDYNRLKTSDDHVLLTLPVTTADGNPRRVEASCSICLMDYEVGDSVIRSTRKKCPHAFHAECILQWLSQGKKRCPCCRHFFVPGQAVDDQKFIVDNGADEAINEESDDDVNNTADEAATEAAIIEEIRISAHQQSPTRMDSPRRRSSGHEGRVAPLPREAETVVTVHTT